ncbi:MAG: DUF2520 domain-containing protein, partial [Gillisia sp.]
MIQIVLLGSGNVATHLFKAIQKTADFEVVQVYNHNKISLIDFEDFVETTTDLQKIANADLYILALKDDVIGRVAEKIPQKNAVVVHTSGGLDLESLKNFKNRGVFYPLQTFSKSKKVNFKNIPVCIEASNKKVEELLFDLGKSVSEKVVNLTSEQRKSLHVAAVFVSNFVNLMYTEADEICKKYNVPFEILQPLIFETASKIKEINPIEA